VAAVHAGWRGLAGGIIEATLAALPTPPAQLLAWLGPCIGPCHFRVGEDVADALEKSLSTPVGECFQKSGDGGVMVDLRGLASQQLRAAGVSRVSASEHCTFCAKERYFSYRRDGETGRMATFIARI
jgi:YfiH family protein